MIFNCRLIDKCLDCPNAHFDIHNEIARPNGSITPTTIKSTVYCRHMAVCQKYLEHSQGDQIIMVPLASFLDREYGPDVSVEEFDGEDGIGDGINE